MNQGSPIRQTDRLAALRSAASRWFSRRRPAPRAHFLWRYVFPVAVAAAAVAVFLLAREGGRAVLVRRVDSVQEAVKYKPDEPGYLELVGATPTLLALHTDDGDLTGVTFVARTGIDAGGGIVLLSADLLVKPENGASGNGEVLGAFFSQGGAAAVERVVEGLFGLGFDQVVEVPTEALAALMQPAGPLPYEILDDLVQVGPDGAARVVYQAGRNDLAAADAAAVYSFRNPDEADVNRLERQREMWVSWLDVIHRAQDPSAATPAADGVWGPVLQALSAGTTVVEVPPIQTVGQDNGSPAYYVLGEDGTSWLRARSLDLVPWPTQPTSFWRPRVLLLDGTGSPAVRDALVDDVVAAGGVITVIGNAPSFGVESTRFAYHRTELVTDPAVNILALQLGLGMTLVEQREGIPDLVDITLTVGLDRVAQ